MYKTLHSYLFSFVYSVWQIMTGIRHNKLSLQHNIPFYFLFTHSTCKSERNTYTVKGK